MARGGQRREVDELFGFDEDHVRFIELS